MKRFYNFVSVYVMSFFNIMALRKTETKIIDSTEFCPKIRT